MPAAIGPLHPGHGSRWTLAAIALAGMTTLAPAQYLEEAFLGATPWPVSWFLANSGARDFDSDGLGDIVVLGGGSLWFVPGSSLLTPPPGPALVVIGSVGTASLLGSGYFDPNPGADLVLGQVATAGPYAMTLLNLLPSLGGGSFAVPGAVVGVLVPAVSRLRTADLNGDHQDDLVGMSVNGIQIILNHHPYWVPAWSLSLPVVIRTPVVGDVNGDGCQDVCWLAAESPYNPSSTVLNILAGNPSDMLGPPSALPLSMPTDQVYILGIGDLDGDGLDDLVLQRGLYNFVYYVIFGDSPSLAGPPVTILSASPLLPYGSREAQVLDLDQDGVADILFDIVVPVSSASSVYRSHFVLLRGFGGRTFASTPESDWLASTAFQASSSETIVGDFDGDSDLDVFGAPQSGSQWFALRNRAIHGTGSPGQNGVPRCGLGPPRRGNAAFALALLGGAPARPAGLFLSRTAAASTGGGLGISLAGNDLLLPAGGLGLVTTDLYGSAAVPLPIPNDPALSGLTVHAQWAVDDPAGTFLFGGHSYALTPTRTIIVW